MDGSPIPEQISTKSHAKRGRPADPRVVRYLAVYRQHLADGDTPAEADVSAWAAASDGLPWHDRSRPRLRAAVARARERAGLPGPPPGPHGPREDREDAVVRRPPMAVRRTAFGRTGTMQWVLQAGSRLGPADGGYPDGTPIDRAGRVAMWSAPGARRRGASGRRDPTAASALAHR